MVNINNFRAKTLQSTNLTKVNIKQPKLDEKKVLQKALHYKSYWDAVGAGVDGKLKPGDTFLHEGTGKLCRVIEVSDLIGGSFSWRPIN